MTADPIRLSELDGILSSAQRAELSAYRQTGPEADLKLEMWENLAQARAAETASATPRSAHGALRWWSMGVLCVGLIAGILLLRRNSAPERALAPPAPSSAHVTAEPSAAPAVHESAQAAAPASLPANKPKRTRVEASPARADALEELKLLTRARRLLPSRPETSLALSREHAELYPRGALAEEREVLAIEALLKLERAPEARQRARAFVRHFPDSSQRARLDALLEHEP